MEYYINTMLVNPRSITPEMVIECCGYLNLPYSGNPSDTYPLVDTYNRLKTTYNHQLNRSEAEVKWDAEPSIKPTSVTKPAKGKIKIGKNDPETIWIKKSDGTITFHPIIGFNENFVVINDGMISVEQINF